MSATAEVIRFAGDVSIDKIQIISANGYGQEVTNQVIALEIYEDLFSPFISGVMAFKDSLDLANLFPFVGEEYVNIAIHTPSMTGPANVINDQFYIYKMTNRETQGNRNAIYELHFISREALVDVNKKVSVPYKGKCSDIIKTIIKDTVNGLESKKNINIEDTANSTKFIANYWSPVKSINHVAEYSLNQNNSLSYLFFESRKGLNFVSLENLYTSNVVQTFISDNFMRTFTPDGRSYRDIPAEYQRIIEISIPKAFDYLDRARSGMYASKMITFDVTTKKFVVKNYDMLTDFKNNKHLNDYPVASNASVRRSASTVFDYSKYYGSFNSYTDTTNTAGIQQRMSLMQQAMATRVEILVPGRTDYTVGQKVFLNLNKFNPIQSSDSSKDVQDKMFSGNYVISAINHSIDRDAHQCKMELIKDSFIVDLNKGGQ